MSKWVSNHWACTKLLFWDPQGITKDKNFKMDIL